MPARTHPAGAGLKVGLLYDPAVDQDEQPAGDESDGAAAQETASTVGGTQPDEPAPGNGSSSEAEHPTQAGESSFLDESAIYEEQTPSGEEVTFDPWAAVYADEEPHGRRALAVSEDTAWSSDESGAGNPSAPARAESGQPVPEPNYETADFVQLLQPVPPLRSRLGWRALLHLPPSEREMKEFAQQEMLRAQFARPVTLMVANPKGGTGKTPTSLVLAGEFGEARGGGVVVFDNNENRGTAAQRSYFSHTRTVADLLEYADELDKPEAQFTDLAYFLAHQNSGKYYVLASDESVTRQVDQELFARVHRILSRFFAVIIIDSGNNELASNWLAGLDVADGLVVPTQWRQDHVVTANKMLKTLREREHPILDRTMIVGTNAPAAEQPGPRQAAFEWFQGRHHLPVMEIPTDAHIHEGGVVDRSKLAPKTRRAALAAAAVASGLIVDIADQPRYSDDRAGWGL